MHCTCTHLKHIWKKSLLWTSNQISVKNINIIFFSPRTYYFFFNNILQLLWHVFLFQLWLLKKREFYLNADFEITFAFSSVKMIIVFIYLINITESVSSHYHCLERNIYLVYCLYYSIGKEIESSRHLENVLTANIHPLLLFWYE